jgi:hypothetical protein
MADEHGTAAPRQFEAERRWRVESFDPEMQSNGPQSPAVKWTALVVLFLFLAASAIAWISMA